MANKVSYIIQLKDSFSRNAKAINRQMKGINKNADKAADTISKKLNKSFKSLGNAAKNAFGAVVAGFGIREFITRGAAFQDAIADLSSITGEAGEQLKFLSDESLRLAKSAAIAQVDVGNAFTAIASSKSELLKDPKALLTVTEQVLLLSNAAGISVPEAIQASVGALNQFGKGAEEAARFVNVMAAGAKVGASLVGQTASALVDAGFASSSAGLSFEQTNAAIQVLAKSELKGARAGVALRNILTIMGTVADGKLDPAIIGINKSLERFAQLNLTGNQLVKIFGRETKDAAGFLIKNVSLFKKWTKELTGTNVAQEQAEKRLGTFNAKLRRLGIIINDKIIKAFLRLEPALTKQITKMAQFFDTISTEQIDGLADSLSGVVEILGILGTAIKIPLALLKGVGTAIGELAGQIATLNFSAGLGTSFADAFSIGGKFLGVIEREKPITQLKIKNLAKEGKNGSRILEGIEKAKENNTNNVSTDIIKSQADVNVNIRAPAGVVESVKTTKTGNRIGLNMGVNMVAQG